MKIEYVHNVYENKDYLFDLVLQIQIKEVFKLATGS